MANILVVCEGVTDGEVAVAKKEFASMMRGHVETRYAFPTGDQVAAGEQFQQLPMYHIGTNKATDKETWVVDGDRVLSNLPFMFTPADRLLVLVSPHLVAVHRLFGVFVTNMVGAHGISGNGDIQGHRSSIVSTMVMEDRGNEALIHKALRSIVRHELAHTFGVEHCTSNPTCVMDSGEGQDVADMPYAFCKVCHSRLSAGRERERSLGWVKAGQKQPHHTEEVAHVDGA